MSLDTAKRTSGILNLPRGTLGKVADPDGANPVSLDISRPGHCNNTCFCTSGLLNLPGGTPGKVADPGF
jgi:hypothetical protein